MKFDQHPKRSGRVPSGPTNVAFSKGLLLGMEAEHLCFAGEREVLAMRRRGGLIRAKLDEMDGEAAAAFVQGLRLSGAPWAKAASFGADAAVEGEHEPMSCIVAAGPNEVCVLRSSWSEGPRAFAAGSMVPEVLEATVSQQEGFLFDLVGGMPG